MLAATISQWVFPSHSHGPPIIPSCWKKLHVDVRDGCSIAHPKTVDYCAKAHAVHEFESRNQKDQSNRNQTSRLYCQHLSPDHLFLQSDAPKSSYGTHLSRQTYSLAAQQPETSPLQFLPPPLPPPCTIAAPAPCLQCIYLDGPRTRNTHALPALRRRGLSARAEAKMADLLAAWTGSPGQPSN